MNTFELLEVWQTGSYRSITENSLRLIVIDNKVTSVQEMAKLSLGERDSRLMQIRENLFGKKLTSLASCPSCTQKVEWISSLDDIGYHERETTEIHQHFQYSHDNYQVHFRLPTSEDIFRDANFFNQQTDTKKIIESCIMQVIKENQPVEPSQIPNSLLHELAGQIEKHDPQSDIGIQLTCPQCACTWESSFDISTYLWKEIDHWANQLLNDVYILARHFGWSENEILSMHPYRRQFYLDKLNS